IDIYAAGILLYEMLTGRVPFEGESAGEILMKHLTTPPDLSRLPFEFVPIISKALSKNPAHRYRTMAEMARDVTSLGTQAAPRPGSWRGRLVLRCVGLGLGREGLWLDGHDLPDLLSPGARATAAEVGAEAPVPEVVPPPRRGWLLDGLFRTGTDLPVAACYL